MSWLAKAVVGAESIVNAAIFDSYRWHKRLYDLFPGVEFKQDQRGFLSRIDLFPEEARVWVLSRTEPQCPSWCSPESFEVKPILGTFLDHKRYLFDLKVVATRTYLERNPDGSIPLNSRGRLQRGKLYSILNPEDLLQWIVSKGLKSGFQVDESSLGISPPVREYFHYKGRNDYHTVTNFRGVLSVVNQEQFSHQYYEGYGKARGFGYGLALLSPIA